MPRSRIQARNIGPFESIAMKAGERQIAGDRQPSVLASDDMVDLKGRAVLRMRDPAVFAAASGPLPNLLDQRLVHRWGEGEFLELRRRRALDCMVDRRLPTCR